MSGRSAYVRKKATKEAAKDGKSLARSHSKSAPSPDNDDVTISDFPLPGGNSQPVGTGVGTTNARFLKFSEPVHEAEPASNRRNTSTMSISSGGSGNSAASREYHDDYGYARPRRPTLRTEDVSGIEKSGLRSMLDKRSDDVRKGLAKTFTFRKKEKDDRRASIDHAVDFRPHSAATVRPHQPGAAHTAELPAFPEQAENERPSAAPGQQQQQHGIFTNPWDGPALPPPQGKLPPVPPPSMAPAIKRWLGSGRPVQRWNKLRKDPELWDPNGDVLIFFGHKGQTPRPNPSFRLSSHIIEATESRQLITMLREGSTEEDLHLPPSPQGAPPMLRQNRKRGNVSGHSGQPTPPVSEDVSLGDADGQISYEMYFPTPASMNKVEQLRHHITTRNVFAVLYHASIVGVSLYQALSDLHTRLDAYLSSDADVARMIIDYLTARGVDDVRNDAETAVSLLAWSESHEVRWEEGWRESFLHCAGMYSQLEQCSDFKALTPITRALLERACLEMQLRVQGAEERLADLHADDMWPTSGPTASSPAKAAADRFHAFLIAHYSAVYGSWPPPAQRQQQQAISPGGENQTMDGEDTWLTRTVVQGLQKDFGALYDYLVNRDIVWDMSEARSGRKWMMVSEAGNRAFEADSKDLPITDMMVEFDNKMQYPHIPHPYPLVPDSIAPTVTPSAGKEGPSMFRSSKKNAPAGGGGGGGGARSGALERRVQLAYTEATNIYALGSDFTQSDLIDAFVKFEKSDHIGEVDPAVARRGRWVLIYGVLQTLATVSVDAPNVRHRDNVPYHLSPRLRGTRTPPWKAPSAGQVHKSGGGRGRVLEASHELSHCWLAPRYWATTGSENSEEEENTREADYYASGGVSPGVGPGGRSMSGKAWAKSPRPFGSMSSAGAEGHPGANNLSPYDTPTGRAQFPGGVGSPHSVTSESDAGSRTSSRPPGKMSRARSREKKSARGGAGGGYGYGQGQGQGLSGFGGFDPMDEPEYISRRQQFGNNEGTLGVYGGRSQASSTSPPIERTGSSRPPRIMDFDLDSVEETVWRR